MKAASSGGQACGAWHAPIDGCGGVMTNDRIVVYGHLNSPSSNLASIRSSLQPMIMSTEWVELGLLGALVFTRRLEPDGGRTVRARSDVVARIGDSTERVNLFGVGHR